MTKLVLRFLVLVLLGSIASADIDITTAMRYVKQVNGHAGYEFAIESTTDLGSMDLIINASQGYTMRRDQVGGWNHAGQKLEIGVLWDLLADLQLGYLHSMASWYEDAKPKVIFNYDSNEVFTLQKRVIVK